MQIPLNKINQEYNVGCRSHKLHKHDIDVIHGRSKRRTPRGESYWAVKATTHGIQKKYWEVDNDTGRVHADSQSYNFRGYDTVEF
jgi:hypothetical protein